MSGPAKRSSGPIAFLFGLFGVLLLAAGCETTPVVEFAGPSPAWLVGRWTTGHIPWEQNLDVSSVEGGTVQGSYDISDPGTGRTYFGSVEGTVNGNRVFLRTTMYDFPEDFTLDLERVGEILEGTRIGGAKSWSLLLTKEEP